MERQKAVWVTAAVGLAARWGSPGEADDAVQEACLRLSRPRMDLLCCTWLILAVMRMG
jgi:hypothetical protein